MEPRDYLQLLRRHWRSVLIVALATLAVTAAVTFLPTPRYTATTQMFFGVRGGQSVSDLAQGSTFTEQQMSSYARVATSPLVLNPVINQLDLRTTSSELAKNLTATVPLETVVLEIAATDPDAGRAARIANAVGAQLATVVGDIDPTGQADQQSVRATIFAAAEPPTSPSTPRVPLNLAVGLVLALVLGVGTALLRHLLNSRVSSVQDVTDMTDSPVLGVIPFDASTATTTVVMHNDPGDARSEAIRRIRANLRFVDMAEHVKSIVVSSSVVQEGKTTTALNLAVAMADTGARVVVVEADLRRPSFARQLGLDGASGLTTVLIGDAELADAVQRWEGTGLDVLTAGQLPPNPSELLDSGAMTTVIEQLSSAYDMVILDSPPLLPVSDALVLSKSAGGTILVVGVDEVHRRELRDSLESLSTVDANLLGLVVNKLAARDAGALLYDAGHPPTWESSPTIRSAPGRRERSGRGRGRS